MIQSVAMSSARSVSSYFDPIFQEGGGKPKKTTPKTTTTVLPSTAEPTVSSVFFAYLKEASGVKNVIFKVISYASDWTFTFLPDLTAAKTLATSTKDAKNWASAAEVPGKAADVVGAGAEFCDRPGAGSFASLVNKVGLLIAPAIDVLRVASDKVRPMCAATAQTVSNVFNSAIVFTTSYGSVEELMKIGSQRSASLPQEDGLKGRAIEARDAQLTQSWLKIATNTNYFAIGALGLATFFTQLTVAPWIILALATNGLIFTLVSHFQNKLVVEPAVAKVTAASAEGTV
jgi:hypothetical protein